MYTLDCISMYFYHNHELEIMPLLCSHTHTHTHTHTNTIWKRKSSIFPTIERERRDWKEIEWKGWLAVDDDGGWDVVHHQRRRRRWQDAVKWWGWGWVEGDICDDCVGGRTSWYYRSSILQFNCSCQTIVSPIRLAKFHFIMYRNLYL